MDEALKAFRLIGKEFEQMPDEEVQGYLDLFAPMVSRKQFGKMYGTALAYYAAHKCKLQGLGGGEDEDKKNAALNMGIASYSEGDTSISYASSSASGGSTDAGAELSLTVYGMQYLGLLRSCIMCINI